MNRSTRNRLVVLGSMVLLGGMLLLPRLAGAADDPVAVHAEVRVQRAPVVEPQQLVLPAPLDALEGRAGDGLRGARGQRTGGARVQRADARQALALRGTLEDLAGAFDLGELGHGRKLAPASATGHGSG
jgi:hypothetical protein